MHNSIYLESDLSIHFGKKGGRKQQSKSTEKLLKKILSHFFLKGEVQ